MIVKPDHRKKGIAQRFITEALTWMREKECTSCEIDLIDTGTNAKPLYKKMGFTKAPDQDDVFILAF